MQTRNTEIHWPLDMSCNAFLFHSCPKSLLRQGAARLDHIVPDRFQSSEESSKDKAKTSKREKKESKKQKENTVDKKTKKRKKNANEEEEDDDDEEHDCKKPLGGNGDDDDDGDDDIFGGLKGLDDLMGGDGAKKRPASAKKGKGGDGDSKKKTKPTKKRLEARNLHDGLAQKFAEPCLYCIMSTSVQAAEPLPFQHMIENAESYQPYSEYRSFDFILVV